MKKYHKNNLLQSLVLLFVQLCFFRSVLVEIFFGLGSWGICFRTFCLFQTVISHGIK